MYLFALLVALLPPLISGMGDRKLMLIHALTLQPWSSNLERAYAFNGPAWSIGVEVFLYACFPLAIHFLAKVKDARAVLICVGLVVIATSFGLAWWFFATGRGELPWTDSESAHRWLYRTPATRLGDFLLGVVVALLVKSSKPPKWIPKLAQFVGAGSVLALMCNPNLLFTVWSWDAAYMFPTALLLWGLAAGPSTVAGRLLGTKPMVLLGQASFAFYLLHALILSSWPNLAMTTQGWAAVAVTQFALIAFMAIGVHLCLEEPARRWLVRVLNRKPRAVDHPPLPLQMIS